MAPRPTSDQGAPKNEYGIPDWNLWVPPECPDVSHISWWNEFNPPWKRDITKLAIDDERTARLAETDVNRPIRLGVNEKTTGGVYGGNPYQLLDPSTTTVTKVYDAKKTPTWQTGLFPSQRVPMPDKDKGGEYVRRFGDPTVTGSDAQSYFIDTANKLYYELSAFGPTFWPFSVLIAPWRADNISVWDLKRNWDTQRAGITAAKVPLLPMVPKIEEYESGTIPHAIHFVAAGYSPEKVWPARSSDGEHVGHPLRAGETLRLRPEVASNLLAGPTTPHDRALIQALIKYGMILTDKTGYDVPHTIRQPQDPRLNMSIKLMLTDFVVVKNPQDI